MCFRLEKPRDDLYRLSMDRLIGKMADLRDDSTSRSVSDVDDIHRESPEESAKFSVAARASAPPNHHQSGSSPGSLWAQRFGLPPAALMAIDTSLLSSRGDSPSGDSAADSAGSGVSSTSSQTSDSDGASGCGSIESTDDDNGRVETADDALERDATPIRLPDFKFPVAEKNPDAHLLRVAGEIRNQIYKYLDLTGGVVCLHCPRAQGATYHERYVKPAITRVCYKLRDETCDLYYRGNRFEMTCCWMSGSTSCSEFHGGRQGLMQREWLRSVEPFWPMIQDVKFRLAGWPTWTRFRITRSVPTLTGVGYGGLWVVTGEPVGEWRTALLQLLVDSYFFAPQRLTPYWEGRDLCTMLSDLPRIVARLEATARISHRLMRRITHGLEGDMWAPCFKGFLAVAHGFEPVDLFANTPPVLRWDTLVGDLESLIEESEDAPGTRASLVRKGAPRISEIDLLHPPGAETIGFG